MPPRMNIDPEGSTKVNMDNILPEEVEYICCQDN
jgi:hypothetical protein